MFRGRYKSKLAGKCCKRSGIKEEISTPLSKKGRCGKTKIRRVSGDRKQCARMASLGIYPGSEIELICPSNNEGCLIKVHGGTMSLDRETMDSIMVSE